MTVQRVALPEHTFTTLAAVDYGDRFVLTTDATSTPEGWARALFGDVPTIGERFIWRALLGLRLQPGASPDTVAGWRIGGRGENWIRLEAASWFLAANLVVTSGDGQVALTTLLRYDRLPGRFWWPPLSAVHRRLVPSVFGRAEAQVRRTPTS